MSEASDNSIFAVEVITLVAPTITTSVANIHQMKQITIFSGRSMNKVN